MANYTKRIECYNDQATILLRLDMRIEEGKTKEDFMDTILEELTKRGDIDGYSYEVLKSLWLME